MNLFQILRRRDPLPGSEADVSEKLDHFGIDVREVERIPIGKTKQVYKAKLEKKSIVIKFYERSKKSKLVKLHKILNSNNIHNETILYYGNNFIVCEMINGLNGVKLSKSGNKNIFRKIGGNIKRIHEIEMSGYGALVEIEGVVRGKKSSKKSISDKEIEKLESISKYCKLEKSDIENLYEAVTIINKQSMKKSVLIHKDINYSNIIYESSEKINIIDWDSSAAGDNIFDLARCCYKMIANIDPIVEGYRENGGAFDNRKFESYLLFMSMKQIFNFSNTQPGNLNGLDLKIRKFAAIRDRLNIGK